jgi:hypothetical protein
MRDKDKKERSKIEMIKIVTKGKEVQETKTRTKQIVDKQE